jgi:hypothetical protein
LGKPVLGTVPKVHKQVPVPVDMVPVLIPNADTENFKTYPQNTKEENNKKNTKKEEETLSTHTNTHLAAPLKTEEKKTISEQWY